MLQSGIDIVIRAKNFANAGVADARKQMESLSQRAAVLNQQSSQIGGGINALRGGAAVAAISLVARNIAEGAEKARDLATEMRQVNVSVLDIAARAAEAVPIFGQLVTSGRRISEALIEAVTGEQAAAVAARVHAQNLAAAAAEADKLRSSMDRIAEAQQTRIQATEDAIRIRMAETDGGDVNALRREIELRDAQKRQAQELEQIESTILDLYQQELLAAGEMVEAQERAVAAMERRRQEAQATAKVELDVLRERHDLERQIALTQAEEQGRAAEEERRERESAEADVLRLRRRLTDDLLSDEQRRRRDFEEEIESLRKRGIGADVLDEIRREFDEMLGRNTQNRASGPDGRLAAAVSGRFLDARAESFRMRERQNDPTTKAIEDQTTLITRINTSLDLLTRNLGVA